MEVCCLVENELFVYKKYHDTHEKVPAEGDKVNKLPIILE